MKQTINYLTINEELFPYTQPKYGERDSRITGKHFLYVLTADAPQERINKMKTGEYTTQAIVHSAITEPSCIAVHRICNCTYEMNIAVCKQCLYYRDKVVKEAWVETKQVCVKAPVIDIRDIAEARVLEKHPEYQDLTSYGTRRKGYWKYVRLETQSTLWWVMNKQPASITFITNKIDGIATKADEVTDPNSLYGKIQICMQSGVTVQIIVPETGYSCIVEPVINKKLIPIFTQDFLCEKYLNFLDKVEDPEAEIELTEEYKDIYTDYEANPVIVRQALETKANKLRDYRQELQNSIWTSINYALKENGYLEQWKLENLYTVETRMAFAINSQTEDTLNKYAGDLRIHPTQALTLDDLRNPDTFKDMLDTIAVYGSAYGFNVKVTEQQPDTMTYMPKEWIRTQPGSVLSESIMIKQAQRINRGLKRDALNELLNAYIQIDWYQSQPNPEDFYAPGWFKCTCGKPVRDTATHFRTDNEIVTPDTYVSYSEIQPVTICPHCGAIHEAPMVKEQSYEVMAYKLDQDRE